MGSFNRSYSGGRGRGGNRDFNNRGFGKPTMFKTICSNCGKECEVPFKPNGEKPVYCRDCFKEMGGDTKRSDDRNVARPYAEQRNSENKSTDNFQYKQELMTIHAKVDKILSILASAISSEEPQQEVLPEELLQTEVSPKKKRVYKKAS